MQYFWIKKTHIHFFLQTYKYVTINSYTSRKVLVEPGRCGKHKQSIPYYPTSEHLFPTRYKIKALLKAQPEGVTQL